jgi:hypothetical protein
MELAEVTDLTFKIRNLKELLTLSIRIGESGISRDIRNLIEKREKELRISKVIYEKRNKHKD